MATNHKGASNVGRGHQATTEDARIEAAMMAVAEILLEISSAKSNPSAEEEIATKKRKEQAKDD